MDRNIILSRIKSDSNLLPMPQVIARLLEITSDDDYTANDLAATILKDSSLTAKVLQISNSSFYNRGTKITSVNQAISMIGANAIKCLALSTSVLDLDRITAESGLNSREFFTYILSVAAAAELLAKTINMKNPEEALISGLLHEIGVIYLLNNHPKEYREVIIKQRQGASVMESETAIFGISHGELGYLLATTWKLPERIAIAIRNHGDYENLGKDDLLGNIVKLGILLTFDKYANPNQDIEERLRKIDELSQFLGIDSERVAEVTRALISRTVEISEIIGVDITNTEELLIKANQEIWKSYMTIERLFREREQLNRKIIMQERVRGALEARDEALSTLSHYLNNAVMVISGQAQILSMMRENNQKDKLFDQIPASAEKIKSSINKIMAVMEELKSITPLGQEEYFNYSKAIKLDDRVSQRVKSY